MSLPFYIVDVFAEQKYCGNQLAVCIDSGELATDDMQNIAKEINFSETSFVNPNPLDDGSYVVRIFTPSEEIPFAGHPTLGTAYIIKNKLLNGKTDNIKLSLTAGKIPVQFNDLGMGWMQQNPPEFFRSHDMRTFSSMLSLAEDDFDVRFPIEEVSTGLPFFIVPLKSLAAVQKATLNHLVYSNYISTTKAKAVYLFCPETYEAENDFNARMFAPYYGITEDAATGSASGCLAAYLVKHRYTQQTSINARVEQGYEIHRPSIISLNAQEAMGLIEISIGGRCVNIAQGEWVI